MIITDLTVSGIGRFDTPHRLAGLGPGLNVLAAPNETGKSTLLAALLAVFREKHTASGQGIEALATQGADLAARVDVSLDAGGTQWRIVKSFLRQKRAELWREGRLLAQNTEADEQIWSLAGIRPLNQRTLAPSALDLLWVVQGTSAGVPQPDGTAAETLQAAVQSQAGSLAGAGLARTLLARLDQLLSASRTETGRVKVGSPLRQAMDEAERLRTRLQELKAEAEALDRVRSDLGRIRQQISRDGDPAVRAGLVQQAETTAQALQQAASAASKLATARAACDSARILAEAAGAALARAEADAARLSALEQAREAADAALATAAAIEQTAQAELVAAEAQATEATARLEAVRAAARRTELTAAREAAASRVAAGEAALERARARAAQLEAVTRTVQELAAAAAAEPQLGAIEAAVVRAQAAINATSARLTVTLEPGHDGRLLLDGAVPAGGPVAVARPMRIDVAGVGRVEIEPPAGGSTAVADLDQAQAALADLLRSAGVASATALRAAAGQAREARAALAALKADGGPGPEQAALALDTAQAELGALDQQLAALPPLEPGQPALSFADAETAALAATRRREAALTAQAAARATRTAAQARAGQAQAELEGELARANGAARASAITAAQADTTARTAAFDEARRAQDEAAAAAAAAGDATVLAGRLERQQQAVASLDATLAQARQDEARLEGRLAAAGDAGSDEEIARIDEQLAAADARLQALEAAEAADRLLRATVAEAVAEADHQLVAPVVEAVQPYLDLVFPDARVAVGTDLEVKGLDRALAEPFGQLSMGTREQLGVLARLALADLLDHGPGAPLPVILDDALGHTDAARLEAMYDALHRAARTRQVIVLGCHEQALRALGGRTLTLERSEPA